MKNKIIIIAGTGTLIALLIVACVNYLRINNLVLGTIEHTQESIENLHETITKIDSIRVLLHTVTNSWVIASRAPNTLYRFLPEELGTNILVIHQR